MQYHLPLIVWGDAMETLPRAPARRCAIPKARRQVQDS
jgi:hypothetical protein